MKSVRRIFLLVLSFTSIAIANAQVDSAKAAKAKEKLIDTLCSCISRTDPSTVKTAEDAQNVLIKCFSTDGLTQFVEYVQASGMDLTDTKALQDVGQKIGFELSLKCTALTKMIENVSKDSGEFKKLIDAGNVDSTEKKSSDTDTKQPKEKSN